MYIPAKTIMVTIQLTGYTTISDAKERYCGNTKITQRIRIPQTPTTQVSAGAKDCPMPRNAPEKTSKKTLMNSTPTTTYMRIEPVAIISGSDVYNESKGFAK